MEPRKARSHCIDGRECNEEIGSPPHKTNHRRRKEEAEKGTSEDKTRVKIDDCTFFSSHQQDLRDFFMRSRSKKATPPRSPFFTRTLMMLFNDPY